MELPIPAGSDPQAGAAPKVMIYVSSSDWIANVRLRKELWLRLVGASVEGIPLEGLNEDAVSDLTCTYRAHIRDGRLYKGRAPAQNSLWREFAGPSNAEE